MTPDNPQERLRALIQATERDLPVAEARGSELPISYSDLRLLLDAASRCIPAGEDAELVERLYSIADGKVYGGTAAEAAARPSSLSSELEQVRAENARLQKQIADMEASFEANVQEMSERFRAVNIGRVLEQSQHDVVGLIKRVATAEARLEKAEEVIRPFAARAEKLDGLWHGRATNWSPAYGNTAITVDDLRAARRWIEGGE